MKMFEPQKEKFLAPQCKKYTANLKLMFEEKSPTRNVPASNCNFFADKHLVVFENHMEVRNHLVRIS